MVGRPFDSSLHRRRVAGSGDDERELALGRGWQDGHGAFGQGKVDDDVDALLGGQEIGHAHADAASGLFDAP